MVRVVSYRGKDWRMTWRKSDMYTCIFMFWKKRMTLMHILIITSKHHHWLRWFISRQKKKCLQCWMSMLPIKIWITCIKWCMTDGGTEEETRIKTQISLSNVFCCDKQNLDLFVYWRDNGEDNETKKARTGKKFPIGPMTQTRKTYYKSTK